MIQLCQENNIFFLRLKEPNIEIFDALSELGILVAVGPKNGDLPGLALSSEAAFGWVNMFIGSYVDSVFFKWIIVGDEEILGENGIYVRGAMINIRNHVSKLADKVLVTTLLPPNALSVSFPPSAGDFSEKIKQNMTEIAEFLASHGKHISVFYLCYQLK